MSISSIDGGQRPSQVTPGTPRPSVAELLQNDSRKIQLSQLNPQQLAQLRSYQSGVLENIGSIQGGFGMVFPPLPGPNHPCPTPPPIPQPADPKEILRTQDPEAYAAFSQLKPEDQQAFLSLVRIVGMEMPRRGGFGGLMGARLQGGILPPPLPEKQSPGGIFGGLGKLSLGGMGHMKLPPLQPQINNDLLTLLKSGKLSKKDSKGRTLLQNLGNLSTQEMGPTLDRKTIFRQLCSQLADPGKIVQGSHGTCAPTTIQHLLASKDPSEYARLMVGLTSKDGSVTMRNGDELKRDRGSLGFDGNFGRDVSNRIFQSALMEYANGEDEYDNRTDKHTAEDGSTYSGLSNADSEKAMEALFGKDFQSIRVDRGTAEGRERTERMLQDAVNRGIQVPVSMNWRNGSNHMLSLVGMTESTVILRNPWGGHDTATSEENRGPERQALDGGGTVEMSKEEFFQRCYNIILPGEETAKKLQNYQMKSIGKQIFRDE